MTISLEKLQVFDVTDKFALAERLVGNAGLPKHTLELIFWGAIQQIEKKVNKELGAPLKERVWNKVSTKQLESLKEHFLLEFCKKILGTFNNTQAKEMLEEHKKTDLVRHSTYSLQIQIAYRSHRQQLIDSVVNKAKSMTDAWIPEIVKALGEEGIELPNP